MKTQRILLFEDAQSISHLRSQIANTLFKLNSVNQIFPIESADQIPTDYKKLVADKARKLIPQIAEDEKIYARTNISDYVLPDELHTLSKVLSEWGTLVKDGMEYIFRGKIQFEIDSDRVEEDLDQKFRVFATTPEQIERLKESKTICEIFSKYGKDLHPMFSNRFNCPLVIHNMDDTWIVNFNFVKTGSTEPMTADTANYHAFIQRHI